MEDKKEGVLGELVKWVEMRELLGYLGLRE